MAQQPAPQFVLQEGRVRALLQGIGQDLTRGIGLLLALQQLYLHGQGLKVVRVQLQGFVEGRGGFLETVFVQVKLGQMQLRGRVVGLLCEYLLILLQGVLQGAEVQTDIVRPQPQQGIDHGEAHALLFIVEQRSEGQAALGAGQHGLNAGDGGTANQGIVVLQVAVGQFQCQRRGVVGQFGVQAGTADGGKIAAAQLLIQHPGRAGLAVVGHGQGLGIGVLECWRWRGAVVTPEVPAKAQDDKQDQADQGVLALFRHGWIRGTRQARVSACDR
ncbi:hypothetical protein D3C80_1276000 [compost metagenome]